MIFLVHNSHRNFNNLPYQINSILLGTVHEYKRLTQLTDHQRWKPKGQGVIMFLQRLSEWLSSLTNLSSLLAKRVVCQPWQFHPNHLINIWMHYNFDPFQRGVYHYVNYIRHYCYSGMDFFTLYDVTIFFCQSDTSKHKIIYVHV